MSIIFWEYYCESFFKLIFGEKIFQCPFFVSNLVCHWSVKKEPSASMGKTSLFYLVFFTLFLQINEHVQRDNMNHKYLKQGDFGETNRDFLWVIFSALFNFFYVVQFSLNFFDLNSEKFQFSLDNFL